VRDRSRAAAKRPHQIASKLRLRAETRRRPTLAEIAVQDAQRLLVNAQRAAPRAGGGRRAAGACEHDPAAGRRRGRLARAANDLTELLDATPPEHCPDLPPPGRHHPKRRHPTSQPARPGRRADRQDRPSRPIAFGHKAHVVDNDDNVLTTPPNPGNPADVPPVRPRRGAGHPPHRPHAAHVTADRGYGEERVEDAHRRHPRKGTPGKTRQAVETPAGVPPHGENGEPAAKAG
jgi:IS5 family transposase